MSSFDKGLQVGSDTLHWLLNLIGGIIGFLLPFIVVGIGLGLLCLVAFLVFDMPWRKSDD